jgi:glycosyltransferase involved in cell wall biosynthesis
MDAITQGLLHAGHSVRIVTACTHKHPDTETDSTYRDQTRLTSVFIDTTPNARDAFSHLIAGESYHVGRFHHPDMERVLRDILRAETFDLVLFESLFTAPYLPLIRQYCDGLLVLRAHNVEHRIWRKLVEEEGAVTRKLYLRWITDQLARYEQSVLNAFDAVVAISEEDRGILRELGCRRPIHVTPFGIDAAELPDVTDAPVDHVFHFGSMDWQPNLQGLHWFRQEVWPRIRAQEPGVQWVVAGRKCPPEWTSDAAHGIQVIGEVEDAWEMLARPGVMVVPLQTGSGMRIKVVEGLAAGRPVVSTSVGVEGLPLVAGEHVRVADDPEAFAREVVALLRHPDEARALGGRGREHVLAHYENAQLVGQMLQFLQNLLA